MKHMKSFEQHNNDLEYTVTGVKCDNCDWSDMSFTWDDLDTIEKEWVNKPCPECGENLLTQDDFDEVKNMTNATNQANQYTQEEIDKMLKNLSPEDMDKVLDMMNSMGLKKTGEDENGIETWSSKK